MFFILGYGIFRNFGIWDIGIYFGIRVKLILGYGIYWMVYFGIWDIAYPPNQASLLFTDVISRLVNMVIMSHICCIFLNYPYSSCRNVVNTSLNIFREKTDCLH